jgi:hypothetical protein
MKVCGGVVVSSVILDLDATCPGRFYPSNITTETHCTGGWKAQEPVWMLWIREQFIAPCRESNPDSTAV